MQTTVLLLNESVVEIMWRSGLKYVLAGGLFWIVGALFLGGSQGFLKRSEPAELIVLQMDTSRNTDGHTMYRPVFALETTARPRPEYVGNSWMRPAPHQAGDIVPGRYDPETGEMRSDKMTGTTIWTGRAAQVIGLLAALQGILMLFGVPELCLPLRVRLGS